MKNCEFADKCEIIQKHRVKEYELKLQIEKSKLKISNMR